MDFPAQKLEVGTANFGSNYGIKKSGISERDVFKIFNEVAMREDIFVEIGENYLGHFGAIIRTNINWLDSIRRLLP